MSLLVRVWPSSCRILFLPPSPSSYPYRTIPPAMITVRKLIYGVLFLPIWVWADCLVALWAAWALLKFGCERVRNSPRGVKEENLLASVSWFIIPVGDLTGLSNAAGYWWTPPLNIWSQLHVATLLSCASMFIRKCCKISYPLHR